MNIVLWLAVYVVALNFKATTASGTGETSLESSTVSTSTSSTTVSSSTMASTMSTNSSENDPSESNSPEIPAAASSTTQYLPSVDSALPSGFTLITASASGVTGLETFVPVTLSLSNLPDSAFSTYVTDASGDTLSALIGPSGVGWEAFGIPSDISIVYPTVFPSSTQENGTSTAQSSPSSSDLTSATMWQTPTTLISGSTSPSSLSNNLPPFFPNPLPVSTQSTAATPTTNGGFVDLPFITPSPATVSAVTSSIQGVTSNTLATVNRGPDKNVIVPFFFHCLIFCPAKDLGILIFGVGPLPGIYVLNPPPIPSLHAITIGHDNKPTPGTESPKPTQTQQTSKESTSKDSTTTSTRGCSQSTTTGCFTSCADKGSTTSCSTTCSTISGCTVTATNSATTSECQLPDTSGFPFAFGPDGLTILGMNQSAAQSTTTLVNSTGPVSTIVSSTTSLVAVSLSTTIPSTDSPTSLPTQSPSPNPNYCLPTFLNQNQCTCTNGTTTPQSSNGNCPNPLPPDNPDQIFIWHYYYASSTNGNNTNNYEISQQLNTSEPLSDLLQQAIYSLPTEDDISQLPVQLGPFNIADSTRGSCNYTGTALQEGMVTCDNGSQIPCYLLWGGKADQDQAKDADWDIELARLLIICSNSL